ncbi:MAG: rod shape-determining protein, partial [Clostridia bacterium]|nr:rod shape-determining protein [Clostridia bacterium]
SLGGHLSFVTCDANFVRVVKDAAKKCGIGEIVFVYDLLAESLIALGDNSRGKVLLVDSGYITTGAAVISPRGVLKKTSCDYGGGYITALLYEKFGLSLETAEELKRKINLGMMRSPESLYRIYDGNKTVVLPASEVNDAVRESLDELVGELDAFIAESEMGDNLKILLTGGGLAYLRGVREHISDRLDIPVEIFAPPSVQFSKCFDTSKVALLECALRDKEKTGRIKFLTIEE